LERLNKETKPLANVVGIFPNGRAAFHLVGAILLEQDDEWAVADRRDFGAETMARLTAPLVPAPEYQLLMAIAWCDGDHELRKDTLEFPSLDGTLPAILDRLLYHSITVTIRGDGYW
jgi:hypothetical protein